MIIRSKLLHIVFWVFSFLYVFDYFIDAFDPLTALGYSCFEISILLGEFYLNMLVLIPLFLIKRNALLYSISLVILLATGFGIYLVFMMDSVLLSESFPRAVISFILNHSFFLFISFMLSFFQRYQEQRVRSIQLEKEKLVLEIAALKSQISPHFLFNTLNNIYSLSLAKDDNAPKMLAATSEILRYYVNNGQKKLVSVNSEIIILKKYIEIQQMRKLRGNIKVTFDAFSEHDLIPPLIILSLVENAFKHGDIITSNNGFVEVEVRKVAGQITMVVHNSFTGEGEKNGVGLTNIKAQLELLYGNKFLLEATIDNNTYQTQLILNEQ